MNKRVLKTEFVNVPFKIVDAMLEIDKLEAQKRALSAKIAHLKSPIEDLKSLYRDDKRMLQLAVETFGNQKVYKHLGADGEAEGIAFTEPINTQLELFEGADHYEDPIPSTPSEKKAIGSKKVEPRKESVKVEPSASHEGKLVEEESSKPDVVSVDPLTGEVLTDDGKTSKVKPRSKAKSQTSPKAKPTRTSKPKAQPSQAGIV